VRRVAAVRAVTADAGDFVITFGYDEAVVKAVRLLDGRRWDGATKTWRVPGASRVAVAEFIANWNFGMDADAKLLLAGDSRLTVVPGNGEADVDPRKLARGSVELEGEHFALRFPYDAKVKAAVEGLPQRRWTSLHRAWLVPTWLAPRVFALAEQFGLEVSELAAQVPVGDGKLPVQVRLEADEIAVEFPFHDRVNSALYASYGRWNHRESQWQVPLNRMKLLLQKLDAIDFITVEGRKELEAAVADADLARLWSETDEAVEPLCELGVDLAGWQWGGVRYAMHERPDGGRGQTFLSAAVGLGKTRVALATIKAADAFPAVILVPPTLVVNWYREASAALPECDIALVSGHKPRDFGMHIPDIVIGSYDVAHFWRRTLLDELQPKALIVDESQAVKEWDTRRTKAAIALGQSLPRDAIKLNLTATPVLNHRREFAPQLAVIGRLDNFGGRERVKNMPDIADALRARWCMWRPDRSKIQAQLTEPRHAPVVIAESELDAKVMEDYRRAERELLAYLGDKAAEVAERTGADPFTARWEAQMRAQGAEHLIRIGVCKRLAAKAKVPAVKRWVKDFYESDESKLLLFGSSVELLDELGVHYNVPVIRGSSGETNAETAVDSGARMAVVDRFQNTDLPMVVLSLRTGGTGLTLTQSSHVGFVEMGWTPGIHDQALGRCYGRMNDAHGAIGWYFIAENTVDERIVQLLDHKRREIDNATDGTEFEDDGKGSILNELVTALTKRALGVE
jgi:hypothetical protein